MVGQPNDASGPEAPVTAVSRSSAASQRFESLDLARGILILLVVLLHAHAHNFTDVAGNSPLMKAWDFLVSATRPIRMPAFFMISGFLAKSLVRREWRTLVEKRVAFLLYMYLVWLFLNFSVSTLLSQKRGEASSFADLPGTIASNLLVPYNFLWFLWALALYNVIARASVRLPLWPVLAVAAVASAFSEQLQQQPSYIVRCALFFLIGALAPQVVTALLSRARWTVVGALVLAYLASIGLIMMLGERFVGVWLPASTIGSALVIMVAALVADWPLLAPLKYLGRNTIQIYVLHPMVIAILTHLEMTYADGMIDTLRRMPSLLAIYPLLFLAMVVGIALLAHRAVLAAGASWLFALPIRPAGAGARELARGRDRPSQLR